MQRYNLFCNYKICSKKRSACLLNLMEWFGAAMDDDNGLTAQEVEEFNKRYAQMVEDANRKMEAINQAGIDISGSKDGGSTALTGAIKGITENTASLLAGQMNGIRINVVQQLERMGAILTAVQGIKNDTGQYLPYLQSINAGKGHIGGMRNDSSG